MLKLTIFILVNAGITYNITSADIFFKFRSFLEKKSVAVGKFVKCSLCLGTWLSIASCYIVYMQKFDVFSVFCFMMIGGITAYITTLCIKALKFINVLLNNKFLKNK